MKKITFFFLLSAGFILPQNAVNLPDCFYKRLEGKIDDSLNIQMNISRTDSILDGNYFYERNGEPIPFRYYSFLGEGGKIFIEEESGYDYEASPIITGIFKGRFITENEIRGKWLTRDSSLIFNFYLNENYPAGSSKFDIKHLSRYYGKSDYYPYAAGIELSCPVMVNFPDTIVEDKINSYVMNVYLSDFSGEEDYYPNLEARIDSFIEDYRQEIEADSEFFKDYRPVYENIESTEIAFNSDNILSLEIMEYLFTGGAHGNSYISLSSFNLQTGEQIKLDDIFYGNYRQKLNEVGEKIFREDYMADSTQSLFDQGFFGFENGFALNNNFDLFKGGIKFQFNPYEAGAYALGAPEVFIHWSDIKDIIRDDSLIGKMLNKDSQSR
jgi:hypothetical protein